MSNAFDPGFVDAYDTTTGRKQRVPAHYIGHPVLGRNLALTPREQAAAEQAPPPAAEAPPSEPETPAPQSLDETPDKPTTRNRKTPAAGDKED